MFFLTPCHSHLNLISAPSIVYVREMFFDWGRGGPNFFPKAKGMDQNFSPYVKGGPEFFAAGKGGDQKKMVTGNYRQTQGVRSCYSNNLHDMQNLRHAFLEHGV